MIKFPVMCTFEEKIFIFNHNNRHALRMFVGKFSLQKKNGKQKGKKVKQGLKKTKTTIRKE